MVVTYEVYADYQPAQFVMTNTLANPVLHRLRIDPALDGGRLCRVQLENYRGTTQ